ncbi:MAG: hypothetical protein HY301_11810 [Verrucomicrobia bacterium]|nr:hypothetical protein [Verrucomicrobiota bacterium]
MSQNLISAVMTDAQRDAMIADLTAFDTKFDGFKVNLTADQVRHLSKHKPEDIGVLEVALTFAQQNPGEVGDATGVAEMVKDIGIANHVIPVNAETNQKAKMTNATLIAALSDAYEKAREIYRVQKAKGRTPANSTFLDSFGARFGHGPQTPPAPPTPPGP